MVCLLSVRRRAITRRMVVCGTSRCRAVMDIGAAAGGLAAAGGAAVGVGAAAGAGDAGAPASAASISARTIRPLGPLPLSAASSSPAWAAMRRARGEAKMRPAGGLAPLPFWGAGEAAAGGEGGGAAAAGADDAGAGEGDGVGEG